jgi:Ca2+-binding RTX toxin-like protein
MLNRRILIGAVLGASALAAVPSAANAAASCTYNPSTRTMDMRMAPGESDVTVVNGATLQFFKDGDFKRSCISSTGIQATAANTDSVIVRAASGAGAATQKVTIDETNGDFSDSNPKLHFTVLTGTGGDRLVVKEGAGNNFVILRNQTEGLAFGPAIDLDSDSDIDIRMTTSDSVVQVNGGKGNDILDAGPASVYQVVLNGEGGNDTLRGGARQDNLIGGTENDRFFAKDGVKDIVTGGTGTDTATLDFNLDDPSSIESQL